MRKFIILLLLAVLATAFVSANRIYLPTIMQTPYSPLPTPEQPESPLPLSAGELFLPAVSK